MMKTIYFLLLLALATNNTSCSRVENSAEQSLSIQLPTSKSFTSSSKSEVNSLMTSTCADTQDGTSKWNNCHLSLTASEINCYAIMIGGDEPEYNASSCQTGVGSSYSEFTFG